MDWIMNCRQNYAAAGAKCTLLAVLTRWQHFSASNDVMAAILKV